MPNPWFRVYSETVHDPKVQIIPEQMRWRLIAIMCLRCSETLETLHETELAFSLRISMTELAETKTVFIAKGFIDENWRLLNWDKRQFASDSSTERVRAHREKKKSATLFDETDEKRSSNAPDTDTEAYTEPKGNKEPFVDKPPKESTKSDLIKQRHADCKAKLKLYWEYKNPGVEMPWGPAEGKQLAMWMQQSPLTSVEQFAEFLRNRAKSEVNHAERPSRWIGNVTSYANGPLNTFRQPLNGGGKSNGKIERSVDVAAKLVAEFENNNSVVERELLSGG